MLMYESYFEIRICRKDNIKVRKYNETKNRIYSIIKKKKRN